MTTFSPASHSEDPSTAELFNELRSTLQWSHDVYTKWLVGSTIVQLEKQSEAQREATQEAPDMKQLLKEKEALLSSLKEMRRDESACLKSYNEAVRELWEARDAVGVLFGEMESNTSRALQQVARCRATRKALESLKRQALAIREVQRKIADLRETGKTMQQRLAGVHSKESAQIASKRAEMKEMNSLLEILKTETESSKEESYTRKAEAKGLSSENEFLERGAQQLAEKMDTAKRTNEFLSVIIKQAEARTECTLSAVHSCNEGIRPFKEMVEQQESAMENKKNYLASLTAFTLKQLQSRRSDSSSALDRLDNERYEIEHLAEDARLQQIQYESISAKWKTTDEMRLALFLECQECVATAEKVKKQLALAKETASAHRIELEHFESKISSLREQHVELFNLTNSMGDYLNRVEQESKAVRMDLKEKQGALQCLEHQLKEMQLGNYSTSRLVMTLKGRLEGLSSSPLSRDELPAADGQAELERLEMELKKLDARQKALEDDHKHRQSFECMLERQAEVEDLKKEISLSDLTYERIRSSQESDLKEKERKLDEGIEKLLAMKRHAEKESDLLLTKLNELANEEKLLKENIDIIKRKRSAEQTAFPSITKETVSSTDEEERRRSSGRQRALGEALANRIVYMYENGLIKGTRKTSRFTEILNKPGKTAPSTPTKAKLFELDSDDEGSVASDTVLSILPKRKRKK